MFWNKKKNIGPVERTVERPSVVTPEQARARGARANRDRTRNLVMVQAEIKTLMPLADKLSGARASTFTDKNDIDFFHFLGHAKATEAKLIFEIDEYEKGAEVDD